MEKLTSNYFMKKGERKLTICMIVVAIMSLTFFISLNALGLLEFSLAQDLRQSTVGESDIILKHKDSELFTLEEIPNGKVLDVLALRGQLTGDKSVHTYIWGVHYNEFLEVFGETYTQKGDVNYPSHLEENQIIIDPLLLEKIGTHDDGYITIELYGQTIEVQPVVAPVDNYFAKANRNQVIISQQVIADLLDLENQMTLAYVYDVEAPEDVKASLETTYDTLDVTLAIDPTYIESSINNYLGIEAMIFVFILMVANDILKSMGLIYVTEQTKEIGTLRSVGLTKKRMIALFSKLGKSIAYRGLIFGYLLGLGGLWLFAKYGIGIQKPIESFSIKWLLVSVVVTFIIIQIMCIKNFVKPIKSKLKQTDRSILLDDVSESMHHPTFNKKEVVYVVLLIITLILSQLTIAWPIPVLSLISCVMFMALYKTIQYATKLIASYFIHRQKKGTLTLAIKNTISNIYLRKTMSLTTMVSTFIILISVLIFSVLSAMTSFYSDYLADAYVKVSDGAPLSEEEIEDLKAIPEIEDTYLYHSGKSRIITEAYESNVSTIGLDDVKAYEAAYFKLDVQWLESFDENNFSNQNSVIISQVLESKMQKTLGDMVTLKAGDTEISYQIVGVTTSLKELGSQIYISRHDEAFLQGAPYNGMYIKSSAVDQVEKAVEVILINRDYKYSNVMDMKENDKTNGMQVIIFFVTFAIFVALTSFTGIYSNYKMSYLMRKKEFAILNTVGFKERDIRSMMLHEIFIISIISFTIGCAILLLIQRMLEHLLGVVDLPIEITVDPVAIASLLAVVLAMMLLNILLAISHSRVYKETRIELLKS